MEKIVKARKIHTCADCNGQIQKGQKYMFRQYKSPRFDNDDNQVGIEYEISRTHVDSPACLGRLLTMPDYKKYYQKCKKGIHEFEPEVTDTEENFTGHEVYSYETIFFYSDKMKCYTCEEKET